MYLLRYTRDLVGRQTLSHRPPLGTCHAVTTLPDQHDPGANFRPDF